MKPGSCWAWWPSGARGRWKNGVPKVVHVHSSPGFQVEVSWKGGLGELLPVRVHNAELEDGRFDVEISNVFAQSALKQKFRGASVLALKPDPFTAYFVLRFSNGVQESTLSPANVTQEMIRGCQEMRDKAGAVVDTKSVQVEDYYGFCLVKPPSRSLFAAVRNGPSKQNGNDKSLGQKEGWPPWLATVLKAGSPICEGSRIAEQWVLSARSCVAPSNFSVYSIRLGSQLSPPSPDELYSVSKIILHSSGAQEDIALIQLAKPAPTTPSLHPICLPDGWHPAPSGTDCLTLSPSAGHGVKQKVLWWTVTSPGNCLLTAASASTCAETSDLEGNPQMTAGGSFVCSGENDQLYLEGLVPFSAGHQRQSNGKSKWPPAAILPVAPLVPWIESQLHL